MNYDTNPILVDGVKYIKIFYNYMTIKKHLSIQRFIIL